MIYCHMFNSMFFSHSILSMYEDLYIAYLRVEVRLMG